MKAAELINGDTFVSVNAQACPLRQRYNVAVSNARDVIVSNAHNVTVSNVKITIVRKRLTLCVCV